MPNMAHVSPWLQRPIRAALRGSALFFPEGERDEIAYAAWQACAAAASRGGFPALMRVTLGELADLLSVRLRDRAGLGPRVTAGGARPPLRRGWLMAIIEDFRRAIRRLRSNPSTLALSIGMLALAVGVTSAMFTVLDALVLHPVPFKDASRLASVMIAKEGGFSPFTAPPALRALQESGAFAAVEAAAQAPVTLEGTEGLATIGAARISPGLLAMLGVTPILGRSFVPDEGRAGSDDRMLISEQIWSAKFNRDPSIVGRRIRVSGVPTEIVGVLPADFRFPYANVRAWQPIDFFAPPPALARLAGRAMAYARLNPLVPVEDARRVAETSVRAAVSLPPEERVQLQPIHSGVDRYAGRAVTAMSVGVGLVFLVLCLNGMNLMLTRFSVRHREFGVCSALGASRSRLVREAVAETAIVATIAAALGFGLAAWLVKLALAYLPDTFTARTLTPVAINWRAIVATSVLAVLAAAIAGVAPAVMATRIDAAEALRSAARTGTDRRAQRRLSRALLVGEVALAAALLAGAAQLARTFVNLVRADRGLNAEGVITGWISLPRFAFADKDSRLSFASALEDRLSRLPGVQQLTLSGGMPPTGGTLYFSPVRADTPGAPELSPTINAFDVTPKFFELFGIPLVQGTTFATPSSPHDVILGQQLATMLFPGGAAVGHSFTIQGHDAPYRVIGVAREIRSPLLDPRLDSPELYHPLVVQQNGRAEPTAPLSGQFNIALRCGASCPAIDTISQAIRSLSAQVEVVSLGPMEEAYLKEIASPRAAAAVAAIFAIVALLTSAGGLFGVLTAAVARRRREFGVRVALGIAPRRLTALIVREAFGLAACGLGFGLVGAWMASRALASLTYGVSPADPLSWAAVFGTLALTTILAAWRPGAQAARVDPAELLRTE